MSDVRVEKFGPTNGRLVGGLGIAAVVAAAVSGLADGWHDSDLLLVSCLALASLLIWVVMFRPSVRSDGTTLELRNMVSTTAVPLAGVDKALVGAMLVVSSGDATYRSIALQRTRREGRSGGTRMEADVPAGTTGRRQGPYSDFVEDRIKHLADEARVHRRGVDLPVRHAWAWPEIAGIVLCSALVVAVLVLR